MNVISRDRLVAEVVRIVTEANIDLDGKAVACLRDAFRRESNERARGILEEILENQEIARNERIPICQDTGVAVFFVDLGNEVRLDFDLQAALDEAVAKAYRDAYLRKSIVRHPLDRVNTRDNTPAVVHIRPTMGSSLRIRFAPKGAGSENMSRIAMLTPADGFDGIVRFAVDTVVAAGGRPCPPIILGVGIGGTFEKAALIAKESLLRELDDEAADSRDRELECAILNAVNATNVGPMGLSGDTTCLAVKVNSYPCHIASLPVAVNIQCHAARHKEIVL
ncbi:MAG: fumarate hydratase [Candidatus Izemoplasmatales bacterium]